LRALSISSMSVRIPEPEVRKFPNEENFIEL